MDPPQIIQRPLDTDDAIDGSSQLDEKESSLEHYRFVIPEGNSKNDFSDIQGSKVH